MIENELKKLRVLYKISRNRKYIQSTTSWQKGKLLGSGSFGMVYEGLTNDGSLFAVKEVSLLAQESHGKESIVQLEQEISLLSQFEHENIVQHLGTCKDDAKLYIFLELVPKGSLAAKMNDIKSCKGTAFWMAPEVVSAMKNNKGYGVAADIWSLGCTVLERLSRKPPYSDLEWIAALFKIANGEPPLIPNSLSRDARGFVLECIQVNPNDRPTASQLLEHSFVKRPRSTPSGPPNLLP